MTPREASKILAAAKHVMEDMGLRIEASEAERIEAMLWFGLEPDDIKRLADYVLPRGRRGRIRLVLLAPEQARAVALIACVLRSIDEPEPIDSTFSRT